MEIQGKIIVACEAREGVSARTGAKWKSQDFVLETHDAPYPRRCCFSVFGEDKLQQFNIKVGDEVTVSFDLDAREFNGRWFNSLRAWKVLHGDAATANTAADVLPQGAAGTIPTPVADPFAPASPAAGGEAQDDLPF